MPVHQRLPVHAEDRRASSFRMGRSKPSEREADCLIFIQVHTCTFGLPLSLIQVNC